MVFHNAIPGTETEDVRKQLDAMRERVNECLPSDIRVLDFERVTRMFCARTNRDKVRYQYMIPSYLLCSREEICKAFNVKSGGDGDGESGAGATSKLTPMEASKMVQDAIDDEVLAKARANGAVEKWPEIVRGYKELSQLHPSCKSGYRSGLSVHSFIQTVGSCHAAGGYKC